MTLDIYWTKFISLLTSILWSRRLSSPAWHFEQRAITRKGIIAARCVRIGDHYSFWRCFRLAIRRRPDNSNAQNFEKSRQRAFARPRHKGRLKDLRRVCIRLHYKRASVKDAGVMQSTLAQVTAESPHQVRQQLETIASDLATVRSLVEQLTTSQKQMALDIASMETGKDNFSQRTWWLSQSAAFHSATSKSQQKNVRSSPSPATSARP